MLTGGQAITEDLGLKLESLTLKDLGRAKRITVDKDNTTIVEGAGKKADIEARVKQIRTPDRGHDLGLRPREAAGAAGQAGRRRRGDQGRRGDRVGDEGEEGARRGRAARDPRGGRRGHRPGRRRRADPRAVGARQRSSSTTSGSTASTSSAAPSRSRCARSPATPASTARSSSTRSRTARARSASTPRPRSTRTWSRPASSTRPRSCARRCRTRRRSPSLMLTTEALIAERPKRRRARRRRFRRCGRSDMRPAPSGHSSRTGARQLTQRPEHLRAGGACRRLRLAQRGVVEAMAAAPSGAASRPQRRWGLTNDVGAPPLSGARRGTP